MRLNNKKPFNNKTHQKRKLQEITMWTNDKNPFAYRWQLSYMNMEVSVRLGAAG